MTRELRALEREARQADREQAAEWAGRQDRLANELRAMLAALGYQITRVEARDGNVLHFVRDHCDRRWLESLCERTWCDEARRAGFVRISCDNGRTSASMGL